MKSLIKCLKWWKFVEKYWNFYSQKQFFATMKSIYNWHFRNQNRKNNNAFSLMKKKTMKKLHLVGNCDLFCPRLRRLSRTFLFYSLYEKRPSFFQTLWSGRRCGPIFSLHSVYLAPTLHSGLEQGHSLFWIKLS